MLVVYFNGQKANFIASIYLLNNQKMCGFLFDADLSSISRHLSAIDSSYASSFGNENWTLLCEAAASMDPTQGKSEIQEIVNRIQRYLHTAGPCTQIPIAEAMVNYKDEDSCQIFVPFVCVSQRFFFSQIAIQKKTVHIFKRMNILQDVKLGSIDTNQLSVDLDESIISNLLLSQSQQQSGVNNMLSGSPPQSGRTSPPVTPSQMAVAMADQKCAEGK